MKVLKRILIGVGIAIALVLVFIAWIFPVGISLWTVWEAPKRASVEVTELKDSSVAQRAGRTLSYLGYEFQVPWEDLDVVRNVSPNRTALVFHSGLRLSITALRAKEFVDVAAVSWFHTSPQKFAAKMGPETTRSDYEFLKRLYTLTPSKMSLWALKPSTHYSESLFLRLKYNALVQAAADSGVFYIASQTYQGFQQGDPDARPDVFVVSLYTSDGGIEFLFDQKNYPNPKGISQSEINRVIQSVNRLSDRENAVR